MPFTLRSIGDAPPPPDEKELLKAAAKKSGKEAPTKEALKEAAAKAAEEAAAKATPALSIATAKMGVKECVEHGLMKPYPMLAEREHELVAQFKCTVLIMPSGLLKVHSLHLYYIYSLQSLQITGLPAPDPAVYATERKIDDEKLAALLRTALKPSKKAKKKAKTTSDKENATGDAQKTADAKKTDVKKSETKKTDAKPKTDAKKKTDAK